MRKHGRGPKIVAVSAYMQKRKGRIWNIGDHRRSNPYRYFCTSHDQYDFGF